MMDVELAQFERWRVVFRSPLVHHLTARGGSPSFQIGGRAVIADQPVYYYHFASKQKKNVLNK